MNIFTRLVVSTAFAFKCLNAAAETSAQKESFSSGNQKVSVIELYTSEGCSSCPTADSWLSGLKHRKGLFKTFIPMAFHVDYWNYLGWRDEFSDAQHSNRQRTYNQIGRIGSVYTPGFVINGEEWRGFFNRLQRNSPLLPPEAGAEETVGNLSLVGRGKQFRAHFAAAQRNDLVIHLAYLGTDLNNNIRRGENAGRTFEHDFVVLAHTQMPLGADGDAVLPRAEIKHATAIAAWVSTRNDPAPIQAVGGWLAVH